MIPTLLIGLSLTGCALFDDDNTSTPSIEIRSPQEGASILAGHSVTLQASVTDPNDPLVMVAVTMRSDVDGELCVRAPGTTGLVECTPSLSAGIHLLTFTATDPDGRSDQASVTVTASGLDGGDGGTADGGGTDGGSDGGGTDTGGTDGGTTDSGAR